MTSCISRSLIYISMLALLCSCGTSHRRETPPVVKTTEKQTHETDGRILEENSQRIGSGRTPFPPNSRRQGPSLNSEHRALRHSCSPNIRRLTELSICDHTRT